MSPVAVSAAYLDHLRRAWNQRFGKVKDRDGSPCRLEDQQVVITIPASFDETARELTIVAAREAGYGDITLLEEPLAAFYAWLDRHESDWSAHLEPGERVLVIDVGGGTSDFSFIEMDERRNLHRFAVGEHLLLGGDNIDMAIARKLEAEWGAKLHGSQWAMLCQLCRAAKERLLDGLAEETDRYWRAPAARTCM
jgi:molecular chaperone DnaK (HSP70)